MTILELLDQKIELAQKNFEHQKMEAETTYRGLGMNSINALREPKVQAAHGYLNALADLRTELVAKGLI